MNRLKLGTSCASPFSNESGALGTPISLGTRTFIVNEVCLLAWRDTIYVGMACHTKMLDITDSGNSKRSLSVIDSFFQTWCKHQVFCSGDVGKSMWKLAPTMTASLPPQIWDLD
jgi:hypothetical protein